MGLLEWCTGCRTANPTMASCEQKVQESSCCSVPQGWIAQLIFCVCCNNIKEISSNAREGLDKLARLWQADQDGKIPSFMSLHRFLAKGMTHFKSVTSCLKTSIKELFLLALRPRSKVIIFPLKGHKPGLLHRQCCQHSFLPSSYRTAHYALNSQWFF